MRVLYITEFFPARVQPWLLNTIEEVVRRGCKVDICATRQQGSTYPAKVDDLGLRSRTIYLYAESRLAAIRMLLPALVPFSRGARQTWSVAAQVTASACVVILTAPKR